MTRIIITIILLALAGGLRAQRVMGLDSCRASALRNNKQIAISQMQRDVAGEMRKSAFTKYLPKVDAMGSYVHNSRNVSILSDRQQGELLALGTMVPGQMGAVLGALGNSMVDAFQTNTRNVYAGTVTVTQPIFMGGSIVALNKIAALTEEMTANAGETTRQQILYNTEKAYWTVVSLSHKKRLADSYLELLKKHDSNMEKMVREGVATRADALSVKVRLNEAETTQQQVNDGLELSRMLLCQICGLPLSERFVLPEENMSILPPAESPVMVDVETAVANRPEIRALHNSVDMSRQMVNMARSGYLPKIMLTGGYVVTNPNVFNGFQNKFDGMWNIGVVVHVPIWNWGDVAHKVRAAKGTAAMADLELEEAKDLMTLQISQAKFKMNEAGKSILQAEQSVANAEENLRAATLGFREGVISSTTVMEAQTAWMQASSRKIDAEINMRLSQVEYEKTVGALR